MEEFKSNLICAILADKCQEVLDVMVHTDMAVASITGNLDKSDKEEVMEVENRLLCKVLFQSY